MCIGADGSSLSQSLHIPSSRDVPLAHLPNKQTFSSPDPGLHPSEGSWTPGCCLDGRQSGPGHFSGPFIDPLVPQIFAEHPLCAGHDLGAGTDRQKALPSQRGQSPCLNSNQCCEVHKKHGACGEGCRGRGGEGRHHLNGQEMNGREWKGNCMTGEGAGIPGGGNS